MLIRGQRSIGMQTRALPDNSLPPDYSDRNVAEQIAFLLDKFSDMQVLLEGKADADKIKTLIGYSNEGFFIQAENIALIGDVTVAKIIKEQNGTTSGQLPAQITRIIGNRVQTGIITSNNWGSAEGTAIDLDNSKIWMGGSNAPSLYYDGAGNLTIAGTLTAGTIIAGAVFIDDTPLTGATMLDVAEAAFFALPADGFSTALDNALATGVGNVLAGTGDDYILDVSNALVTMRHKDALPFDSVGSYTGDLRTGLAISANGIAMGYNQKSDGAWVNSITIDNTTGSGTFKGLVAASSTIADSVEVDGVAVVTIKGNASTGASHAGTTGNPHSTSMAQISGDLDDIADGSTYFRSTATQNTGGTRAANALDSSYNYIRGISTTRIVVSESNPANGVVFDSDGIRGYSSSVLTFNIDTAGNASFAGEVSAGAVIIGSVTTDGVSISTVRTNAATGSSHAGTTGNPHSTALAEVAGDLDDISDGSTYFRSTATQNIGGTRAANALDSSFDYIRGISTTRIVVSESNPTNGVVFDSGGIRGYGGGTLTFSISATDGSAYFGGDVQTDGYVYATGTYAGPSYTSAIQSYTSGSQRGVVGHSTGSGVGTTGISGTGIGLQGGNTSSGGVAIQAVGYSDSDIAVQITQGKLVKSRVNGHLIKVYDTSTHSLVGTYEFSFE